MLPDADAQLATRLAALLNALTPAIVWLWVLSSVGGGIYALRLQSRARRDLCRLESAHVRGPEHYSAVSNLRRVTVRVWMFAGFIVVGACAVLLQLLPDGLARELTRFTYVLTFLVVNALVTYNAWRDDHADKVLRVLLRRDERRPQGGN